MAVIYNSTIVIAIIHNSNDIGDNNSDYSDIFQVFLLNDINFQVFLLKMAVVNITTTTGWPLKDNNWSSNILTVFQKLSVIIVESLLL